METITLRFSSDNPFAASLAALLRESVGVDIMERHTTKRKRKTNYELTLEACDEADNGEGTLFTDFEEFKRHIHAL